ncbi:DUF1702 family protein [Nocardia sp. NPDC051321]|uniref:DUF1702 family protein n=1 Tax=Nocardia sp. NPDC051321 TaxID=3364323 RepID=UPI00379287B7
MTAIGVTRRMLFGIPSAKAVFSRPGFAPEAWQRFGPVAHSLMTGYNATLEDARIPAIQRRVATIEPALQGFAYEGAGMGLAALDLVFPWRNRLAEFVAGPGASHIYPIYVGVGLAYARLRRAPEARLAQLDPVLGWVTADGYGFHEAFFHRRRYVDRHRVPTHLTEYARRLFDQGVGRALWFSSGAVVARVTLSINGFQPDRHADLWSGVGLAAAYGGGTGAAELHDLLAKAQPYAAVLARGAAIAAWGRHQAGNAAPHTDLACQIFAERSAAQAALVVEQARRNLSPLSVEPAHEIWRQRIDHELSTEPAEQPAL